MPRRIQRHSLCLLEQAGLSKLLVDLGYFILYDEYATTLLAVYTAGPVYHKAVRQL